MLLRGKRLRHPTQFIAYIAVIARAFRPSLIRGQWVRLKIEEEFTKGFSKGAAPVLGGKQDLRPGPGLAQDKATAA